MTSELGETIRDTRKRFNLTLRALSERSGLSVSQLSKLENGKQRLSVEVALRIADTLKVPVTSLMSSPRSVVQARRSVTRAGAGLRHVAPGMVFEVLCSEFREKKNIFWTVTVSGRSLVETGGLRSHSGEEFLRVISGHLELHSRHYEPLAMAPGDSILFDGEMEHGYVALHEEPAVLLMSNSTLSAAPVMLPDQAK